MLGIDISNWQSIDSVDLGGRRIMHEENVGVRVDRHDRHGTGTAPGCSLERFATDGIIIDTIGNSVAARLGLVVDGDAGIVAGIGGLRLNDQMVAGSLCHLRHAGQ